MWCIERKMTPGFWLILVLLPIATKLFFTLSVELEGIWLLKFLMRVNLPNLTIRLVICTLLELYAMSWFLDDCLSKLRCRILPTSKSSGKDSQKKIALTLTLK